MKTRLARWAGRWRERHLVRKQTRQTSAARQAKRAAEAGRGTIPITVAGMMRDPARIERFEQAGVSRGFFWIQAEHRDAAEAELDRYTAAVEAYATAGS